jgi:ribosome maturation factor RimP
MSTPKDAEKYVQKTYALLEEVKVRNKLEFTVLKVEFVEEDGNHYLRVYCDMDQEGGIGAEDLAKITRPLNKLLDKADFIPIAYTLEVCSPGYLDEYDDFEEDLEKIRRQEAADAVKTEDAAEAEDAAKTDDAAETEDTVKSENKED